MEREVVTQQRLLEILNEELRQSPECEGAEIVGDLWRMEKGPSGPNWDLEYRVLYEDGSDRLCDEQARLVVRDAYERYNIEWVRPE